MATNEELFGINDALVCSEVDTFVELVRWNSQETPWWLRAVAQRRCLDELAARRTAFPDRAFHISSDNPKEKVSGERRSA